ncbi:MAG: PEP-CTERM sorting domain-containing protein [Rhodospirillales bacterium]|nr:PEP-CTERM sorting domain-containing protein [Rhodospirillales bacterium]
MKFNAACLFAAGLLAAAGWAGEASAAPILSYNSASGAGLGSANVQVDGADVYITKTFDSIAPIDLTFTVTHGTGLGAQSFHFIETVNNNTGVAWTDFHYEILNPFPGLHFNQFNNPNNTYFDGFTNISSQTNQGGPPTRLDFVGNGQTVPHGGSADASFFINTPDPCGNGPDQTPGPSQVCPSPSYTFTLRQLPTTNGGNLPEPTTMGLFGLGMAGLGLIRRRKQQD